MPEGGISMPRQKKAHKAPEKGAKKGKAPGKKEEIFLGTLDSAVVGLQYQETSAVLGEEVYLEREPDNSHDPRAIRVDNRDFCPLGYLPRRDAAWLAPLLDEGLVLGDALLPEAGMLTDQKASLEIGIFASFKGKELLELRPSCTTSQEGLRNLLLQAWQMGQAWENPRMIREITEKLETLVDRSSLPESHLYLRLLRGQEKRAEELGKKRLEESFRELQPGDPNSAGGYTLFFLYASKPSEEEGLLLLDQALEEKSAEITEISSEGSVPELKVTNRGNRPLLLLEGELLRGGKQHRVIRITLIVSPGEERVIPVCCVEQGRWDGAAGSFRADAFAPSSVRRKSNFAGEDPFSESRVQGEVWREVEGILARRGVSSSTESLLEGYEKERSSLEALRKAFVPQPRAQGCMVFRGDRMIGMDVLESPEAFSALWPKISEGYFLASSEEETPPGADPLVPEKEAAGKAQERISKTLEKLRKDPEYPYRYIFEDEDYQGHGVFYGNRLRHLAVFSRGN